LDDDNGDATDAPAVVTNTWNPYDDDGYEITDPKEFTTRHYLKRYLKNSERANNQLLDQRIRAINDNNINNKHESRKAASLLGSLNKTNQLQRETKMLDNYEKYQKIWYKNLHKFDVARNRLNNGVHSKNHKANGE